MMQPGASLSWIVTLVIVIIVVGVLLGTSLAGTDLFNFNRSAADMRAQDEATATQAQRNASDQRVYDAQKQYELAKIEADSRAQQQTAALHAIGNVIDQQIQWMQRLAQAEAQRQAQLAEVEVRRAQQFAQLQAMQEDQAQRRAEQAARATEELKWTNLFNTIKAFGLIFVAVAIAAGIIFSTVVLTWPRFRRARSESLAAKSVTQSHPVQATVPKLATAAAQPTMPPHDNDEYWKEKRRQARANEAVWRETQLHSDFPQGLGKANYQDLPLAAMKNGSTNNDVNLPGRAGSV